MNRNAYPGKHATVGTLDLAFLFNTNGSSDPATSSFDGAKSFIASVKRTGTGVLKVTFVDAVPKVLWCSAELDDTAADGAYATTASLTNEGSATPLTVVIRTLANSGATATDYTARRCALRFTIRNSTVTFG